MRTIKQVLTALAVRRSAVIDFRGQLERDVVEDARAWRAASLADPQELSAASSRAANALGASVAALEAAERVVVELELEMLVFRFTVGLSHPQARLVRVPTVTTKCVQHLCAKAAGERDARDPRDALEEAKARHLDPIKSALVRLARESYVELHPEANTLADEAVWCPRNEQGVSLLYVELIRPSAKGGDA